MPARQQEGDMSVMIVLRIMIVKASTYWTSTRCTVLNSLYALIKSLTAFLMFDC